MAEKAKTVIVTGGSQGIGASAVNAFLERNYNVVATSRSISKLKEMPCSSKLALVEGDVGEAATAAKVATIALERFGSIDALVNNAGVFFTKDFTDYTADDVEQLVSTNLKGFVYTTQQAIKQMLARGSGGSIVSVTAAFADNPVTGLNAAIPWMTKGGLHAITRSLSIEYATAAIRVNAVAPGVVDTPMNRDRPTDMLRRLSPMGVISTTREIVDAVIYLTEAAHITGEVLHVDGGAHAGRW